MDDQARTHLVVSMGRLCRRSVAGGEPSSFLYSTHQPPLWLGWLCSARREVSLIRPHDSWPKREETSSSGFRARNRANFPNWEKKKNVTKLCADGKHAFATCDGKENWMCGAVNANKWAQSKRCNVVSLRHFYCSIGSLCAPSVTYLLHIGVHICLLKGIHLKPKANIHK